MARLPPGWGIGRMIENFHTVTLGVYRSGQPKTRDDWMSLPNDVTRVVKLNLASEDVDQPPTGVEIRYHGMPPATALQLFDAPKLDDVLAATQDIVPGTLVHCEHGQDRTGLVVACYRVLSGQMTIDEARKETLALGYHVELVGLDEAWESFKRYMDGRVARQA